MRILITGSRTWDDTSAIAEALLDERQNPPVVREQPSRMVVVHGDCPKGADAIADHFASGWGWIVEKHPADWRPNGVFDRSAGFKRNAHMVSLGADVCLAFIKDGSKGATMTADLAEKAGIPTKRFLA